MNDRILVVEDEPRLSAFLVKGLESSGFSTELAEDGAAALARAGEGDFDLALLDLGLPDIDGLEVLAEMRAQGIGMPVVILTARDELRDMISGLESGADDYVTKPFRLEELLARIRVRLRSAGTSGPEVLRAAGVELNLRDRTAIYEGETIELTAREFTMLEIFMRNAGRVLSRDELLVMVWGRDYDAGSNVVDVYIGYLRRKLPKGTIRTVRGMGYILIGPESPGDG